MEQPDLDEIRKELASLSEELSEVGEGNFARRIDIRSRQEELRELVRMHATAGDLMSADQLRRQIDLLRQRITAHHGNRLSSISGPQTGMGGGIDPRALHEMNRRMDAAAGIEGMRRRLKQMEDLLAAYESSGGEDGADDGGHEPS